MLSKKEIRQIMSEADENNDGRIDYGGKKKHSLHADCYVSFFCDLLKYCSRHCLEI
jgi:hypothetical protein